MDWNRLVFTGGQAVVVATLGALVGLGYDTFITDALLAVCGSMAGVGLWQMVKRDTGTKSSSSSD